MASDADRGTADSRTEPATVSTKLDRYTDHARGTIDDGLSRVTPERRRQINRLIKACFALLLTAMIVYFAVSYQYGIELFEF